jgi:DNA polymerase-3 subunit beta
MKFKVTKEALLQGLQSVQNVVGTRSTLPILANVLISAEKNNVWLTTSDLDMTIRRRIDATVGKAGGTTLPARRLSSIVRELPSAEIEFDVDEKDVASVTCNTSFFKIMGLSEEEFPPMPEAEGKHSYHIGQGVFKDMLKRTAYAVSTDETRYVLSGVFLSFKNEKLTMVATDGRRLALTENEVDFPKGAELEIILPNKAVNELTHILGDEGDLKIFIRETQIIFEFGDILMASKLIEGIYPNYRQVIPSQCDERVTMEREGLLAAIKRVSLVTTDKANPMTLSFTKNTLTIVMTTPDVGEARETLPVKYSGKDLTVAFNPEFMMDPLRSLTNDEVYLELTDELSPGVIKGDMPFLYVIMPMRVN